MLKLNRNVFVLALACCGTANAQYNTDSESGPLFGGPGDYYYPLVCSGCTVWQDYRNFAWNQLSINGGDARTPTNPNHQTSFGIYTHAKDDLFRATVEITLEIEDVEIWGNEVGHTVVEPEHYFVETHPENGDNVATAYYPKNQGRLQFPYEPLGDPSGDEESGGSSGGSSSGSSGGGGDSSSGGSSGGAFDGSGGGGGSGGSGGGGGGNYCGPGTDYICIQY